MELKDIVYNRSVVEFATVANEFCAYLESLDIRSASAFIGTCQKLLPLLYYKTTLLPVAQPVCDGSNEQFVAELDYVQVENRITQMLRQYNDFLVVCSGECTCTEEHETASIGEYMADVYQDLKNFVCRYQLGNVEIMNDAIWECTENFKEFWGGRLACLVKEFHTLRYSSIDFDNLENSDQNDNASPWNDGAYTKNN